MGSSSSPATGQPMMEKRLRPQHEQALKCPRCESTHTKFCYYNNYSLSQPRYFCKTCRRYWTKGGTLRNIPVGGGCRKNKKATSKKLNENQHLSPLLNPSPISSADLHVSFNEARFSHLHSLFETRQDPSVSAFFLPHSAPVPDFMDGKYESLIGDTRAHDHPLLGNMDDLTMMGNCVGELVPAFQEISTPFGLSVDGNSAENFMEGGHRMMIPFEEDEDVKPNTCKLLVEWQDQSCVENAKESFGYMMNGMNSWPGMLDGYGPLTTNSLI